MNLLYINEINIFHKELIEKLEAVVSVGQMFTSQTRHIVDITCSELLKEYKNKGALSFCEISSYWSGDVLCLYFRIPLDEDMEATISFY